MIVILFVLVFQGSLYLFGLHLQNEKTDFDIGMGIVEKGVDEMNSGQYEKALENFLVCFDHPEKFGPEFRRIKASFLMIYLQRLSEKYPETKVALKTRYDSIQSKIDQGDFNRNEITALKDLIRILSLQEDALRAFYAFKERSGDKIKLKILATELFELLYQNKKYTDIVDSIDLVEKAENEYLSFQKDQSVMKDVRRNGLIESLKKYHMILTETGNKKSADQIMIYLKKLEEQN